MTSETTILTEWLGAPELLPFLALWVVAMMAMPFLAMRGERGRVVGITVATSAQALLVAVILLTNWPLGRALLAIIGVPVLGLLAEFIGSRTGIPFGEYHYTDKLRPQIARVPVAVMLAWLMMMPPAWIAAQVLVPDAGLVVRAIVAGFAFMAWDLYLDPHLVRWDFWRWPKGGRYLGIPLQNFVGWFGWATIMTLVVGPVHLPVAPLAAVYIATWLMHGGAHLVFWRWPVSAGVGFVGMGIVAVPLLARLLGFF